MQVLCLAHSTNEGSGQSTFCIEYNVVQKNHVDLREALCADTGIFVRGEVQPQLAEKSSDNAPPPYLFSPQRLLQRRFNGSISFQDFRRVGRSSIFQGSGSICLFL